MRSGPLRDTPAELVARKLGEQTMRLCAAPDYLARHGTPRTTEELAGHHAVLYASGKREVSWPLADGNGKTPAISMKTRLRFDDLETIAEAVKAGAGIARLPHWLIADELRVGTLTTVLPHASGPCIDLHLAWRRTRQLSTRMRVAIDALVARVPAVLAIGADAPADPRRAAAGPAKPARNLRADGV